MGIGSGGSRSRPTVPSRVGVIKMLSCQKLCPGRVKLGKCKKAIDHCLPQSAVCPSLGLGHDTNNLQVSRFGFESHGARAGMVSSRLSCWCRGSSQTPVSATGANAVKRPKPDDNWFANNLHAWRLPTGRASSQVALPSVVSSRVGWFMWLPPLWSACAISGNSSPTCV
jgi:hypothetical protein